MKERAPKFPNMDWNGSLRSFVSRPPESSYGLLYNYSLDQFPVLEMKQPAVEAQQGVVGGMEKKKRLNNDQLESLERSFQEEVKLDPDRKMKLSKELGLQPRQIAVWFQNRRARWKAKQLEHLYDTLKQEFDAISREKHNLQQEVMRLRSMLREQAARNQGSAAYTDVSGEETVESTSGGVRSSNDYMYNAEDFNQMSGSAPPFWGGGDEGGQLPSYP